MTLLVEGNYAPWNRLAASATSPNVIVVGAGIAGASTSWALSKQGFNVTLVEKAAEAAQEASGNLAGLMMPALATDQSSFAEYLFKPTFTVFSMQKRWHSLISLTFHKQALFSWPLMIVSKRVKKTG
ncbi:tRNA 5-methylaminomethyl-2-thiouridine biosynthesis bifunctional protein MnmC [Piscirickettsia salmonis]|uniref:FAD-dependent oxidoreductase n=1 Tax=Piscirickettsia salmonis TaxID=1238 RepID=UPI001E4A2CD5|nr:FAD-dependent oxidoreductase [Piscirickettsia salmonis]QGP35809.1 tRNA 5-methylaminomethyl-2-thiouridine biosynthesis bifunctional protein MnmC [Piscirickettsia salmonis]